MIKWDIMNNKRYETINISLVEDLIFTYEGSAHLKDLKSGKYLLGNKANAKKVGLAKPEDVYGLTVWDLDQHMSTNWGNLAKEIETFDNQIQHNHKLIIGKNRVFLTPAGELFVHHMKKYPIITAQNKVCSVLTLNQNITKDISLIQLWTMYKNIYNTRKNLNPIDDFLTYLRINPFFYEMPTEAELIILITKHTKRTVKEIANHLNLSPRTIETHIARLNSKCKINLNQLLEFI